MKKTRIKNLLINYEMFSKFIDYLKKFHIKLEFTNLSLQKIVRSFEVVLEGDE